MKNKLVIIVSLIFSAYIGYSDLHQTDTPITVAMLLAAGFVVGLFVSNRAWLFGVIIGIGVPIAGFIAAWRHMILSGMEHGAVKYWPASYESAVTSLVTVIIGIIGVYIGRAVRRLVISNK
jgi:hypothetical protein